MEPDLSGLPLTPAVFGKIVRDNILDDRPNVAVTVSNEEIDRSCKFVVTLPSGAALIHWVNWSDIKTQGEDEDRIGEFANQIATATADILNLLPKQ